MCLGSREGEDKRINNQYWERERCKTGTPTDDDPTLSNVTTPPKLANAGGTGGMSRRFSSGASRRFSLGRTRTRARGRRPGPGTGTTRRGTATTSTRTTTTRTKMRTTTMTRRSTTAGAGEGRAGGEATLPPFRPPRRRRGSSCRPSRSRTKSSSTLEPSTGS